MRRNKDFGLLRTEFDECIGPLSASYFGAILYVKFFFNLV